MLDLFGFAPRPRGTLEVMHGGVVGNRRDPRDLYTEPVAATSALLEVERFPEPVLDPACGADNVLVALRRAGYADVRGSDAADDPAHDFLRSAIEPSASIICNPPYRIADQFVLRALALATGKVAMFLRLQWLEGARRHDRIFARRPPHRVWIFTHRVGMTRDGKTHPSGMLAHIWAVWNQGEPAEHPVLGWISCRAKVRRASEGRP